MELATRKLSEIHPYPNNPRRNDQAVDAVAESIRQCGYVAPIIVDEAGEILAGHTRYKALKKLGRDEAEVVIKAGLTDEQKKKYRLLDNKTNELAGWDFDLLADELEGLDFGDFDFGFDLGLEEEAEEDDPDNLTQEERERLFRERMEAGEEAEEDDEYRDWLDKFAPKKTTDDCYTPKNIYEVVRGWAVSRYGLDGRPIVRPFYPGGDYQKEKYPSGCVVIDNPPFSILSEICRFFDTKGIPFFLFAPAVSLFGAASGEMNYVAAGAGITYENGANIATSFVTNMGDKKLIAAHELRDQIEAANAENLKAMHKQVPKYTYPFEVVTAMALSYMAAHGTDLEIGKKDCRFVRALDCQKESGKAIYGSGFLLSKSAAAERAAAERAAAERAAAERAAAERAAAERAAATVWELSDREKKIVDSLG